jgi:hypothetical protein
MKSLVLETVFESNGIEDCHHTSSKRLIDNVRTRIDVYRRLEDFGQTITSAYVYNKPNAIKRRLTALNIVYRLSTCQFSV